MRIRCKNDPVAWGCGFAAMLAAAGAPAATITVNSSSDGFISGRCTLRSAIQAANANAAQQSCPAGSSSAIDTIVVPPGVYYMSTQGTYWDEANNQTGDFISVSSEDGVAGGLAGNLFQGTAEQRPIALGSRNQYDAGVQQGLGRWILLDVSYFRKYTRNAYDFDALFSTPILFPIGWKQSKLDGVAARIDGRSDAARRTQRSTRTSRCPSATSSPRR